MTSIGIVGLGVVGKAVKEGMRHVFSIYSYDSRNSGERMECICTDESQVVNMDHWAKWLTKSVDGPIFLCVPTPMGTDGRCDIRIIQRVIEDIENLSDPDYRGVLVIKSTVIPGTTDKLNAHLKKCKVCFNPEFLTERTAVSDFKNQKQIIVGGPPEATQIVRQAYNLAFPGVPVIKTSSAAVAEMVKYMRNCFYAVKVAYANEIKNICDSLQLDYDEVSQISTDNPWMGAMHWMVPGPDGQNGFGGKCFPKDINALMSMASDLGLDCDTMRGAWNTNLKVRTDREWETNQPS